MNNKHIVILLSLVACMLLLTACDFGDNRASVDFMNVEGADASMFSVYRQQATDLSKGYPNHCYTPEGDMVNTLLSTSQQKSFASPKTSSTTLIGVYQQLLDFGNQHRVIELSGTYASIGVDGNPIRLSGKVVLPADGNPKRLILVSHYTIASNKEAPSNAFPLESVLCKLGYGIIAPDYIGYGVTAEQVHPYLVMDLTAKNVLDMYFAVVPYLKAIGREPIDDDIYIMGYSQGGATTMAVERLIETAYPNDVKIHRVFAGGGPYDVKATFDRFITTNEASYPCAVPLVMQGMIKGNSLSLDMKALLKPRVYENLDNWINSKMYTTAQINALLGTHVTSEMLTEKGMDPTTAEVSELYKAMTNNSILSYMWKPEAPVYILHSMEDDVVPYENATRAKSKWSGANIQYNFGNYGSHIQTALRFIYTVQTLLREEEKEIESYK